MTDQREVQIAALGVYVYLVLKAVEASAPTREPELCHSQFPATYLSSLRHGKSFMLHNRLAPSGDEVPVSFIVSVPPGAESWYSVAEIDRSGQTRNIRVLSEKEMLRWFGDRPSYTCKRI